MVNTFQLVGSDQTVQIFGVRLIGVSVLNGKRLLFTALLLLLLFAIRWILRRLSGVAIGADHRQADFWRRQGIALVSTIFLIIGLISIWFSDAARLGSAAAFITAGLAVASQRVITALSAYLIILRGRTFRVGDRIVMGGVRGDVIALGFFQTTIMEMGEPIPAQGDPPSTWVFGRQYTGRIVTITNDKLFDNPVYNYTREFPYIWDEMKLPIPYTADRKEAERIILDAARHYTTKISDLGEAAMRELERRYFVRRSELQPRVFYRLTDNWVEMSVRFLTEEHGARDIKDRMSREIMDNFDAAGLGIASGTYQVVGMPELNVRIKET